MERASRKFQQDHDAVHDTTQPTKICPQGYWSTTESKFCYRVKVEKETWDWAKADCENENAILVEILSPEETGYFLNATKEMLLVWVGLTFEGKPHLAFIPSGEEDPSLASVSRTLPTSNKKNNHIETYYINRSSV